MFTAEISAFPRSIFKENSPPQPAEADLAMPNEYLPSFFDIVTENSTGTFTVGSILSVMLSFTLDVYVVGEFFFIFIFSLIIYKKNENVRSD